MSGLNVATRMVRDGTAMGVFSAGNTGATVASSLLNIGRLPGVSRPALASAVAAGRGVEANDEIAKPVRIAIRVVADGVAIGDLDIHSIEINRTKCAAIGAPALNLLPDLPCACVLAASRCPRCTRSFHPACPFFPPATHRHRGSGLSNAVPRSNRPLPNPG